ncbi:MAG: pilus assembly protein PilM [Chloroflexota bacterium]
MTVALDISPAGIKAVSFSGSKVLKAVQGPLMPGLIRDGLILQPAVVGAAIAELLKNSGIPKDRVVLSVTGVPYSYRVITLPRMKPSQREEAIGRAARREMPVPIEELYLSWQLLRQTAGELEYFVIGVPRNVISAVLLTLRNAGIKSFQMDLRPLALARRAGAGQAIIADVGLDSIEIVIVAGGMPVVLHSVAPRPGATAEDNIRRFLEELGKTVMFYNSSRPAHPVEPATPLFLSGDLVSGAAEKELVRGGTEHPVEAFAALLVTPAGISPDEYSVCFGLALITLGRRPARVQGPAYLDVDVDIAVNQYGPRRAGISLKSFILPAVTIVALVLAYTTYNRAQSIRDELIMFESQAAVFSQMLRQARLESEANRELAEQAKAARAEADNLEQEQKDILAQRARFELPLRLFSQLLPPAAYFSNINAAGDTIEMTGEAGSGFDIVAYTAALAGQKEVASARIARLGAPETPMPGAPATRVSFTVVVILKPSA